MFNSLESHIISLLKDNLTLFGTMYTKISHAVGLPLTSFRLQIMNEAVLPSRVVMGFPVS